MRHPGETRLKKSNDPLVLLGQGLGLFVAGGGFIVFVFYLVYLCITGG